MKSKGSAKGLLSVPGRAVALLAALLCLAAACTTDNGPGGGPFLGGGSGGEQAGTGGTYVPPPAPSGSGCPMPYATQLCYCEKDGQQVPGRQACNEGTGWGQCECAEIPETIVTTIARGTAATNPLNIGNADFEWQRTVPEGSCEAGLYEGAFDGLYNSEVMVNLTIGIAPTVQVDGDVSATIQEKPGSNGEFLEIADGVFEGTAMGMIPFVGDFRGELNCDTKSFEGTLENCYYELGFDKYGFQGIALSQYDVVNHAFVNGVWSVTEPASGSIIYSPLNPDASVATDYPPPLDVQPGQTLPDSYPYAFKGGTGNWSMSFVSP
jgi:hypothetical protein